MKNKCLIETHNRSIITICLATQCQGKRVCCSKCLAEFHQHHNVDQLVDLNYIHEFTLTQSQKPKSPSPKVIQALQELNNILKDIDDLTKLIKQEIQRLSSANLQTFCKNLGDKYKIFTEQIGNDEWNGFAQEMLSYVELNQGEIVEKDSLLTHLGQPYSHFMYQFSQNLTKMVKELMVAQQIMDLNHTGIDQKQSIQKYNENMEDIIDPNSMQKLTEMYTLSGHTETIQAIDICQQKNLLVSASRDKTVKIWNLQDNSLLNTFYETDVVYEAVFSCKGGFIAYGGSSKMIKIIEIKDWNIFSEFQGHSDSISRLTFSEDQIYLISGSYDFTIRIWNIQNKVELFKFETGCNVYGLAMSRDNRLIVSHSGSTGIKVWDFKSQKLLCTQEGHSYGAGIIFSNDEEQLISSGSDGKLKIWSLIELNQGKLSLIHEFQPANNRIKKAVLTADSRYILIYCYTTLQVRVIDSKTDDQVKLFEFKNKITRSSYSDVGGVAITRNQNLIAYIDENEVVIWKKGQ